MLGKLIKKLSNFRNTAVITAIISAVSALYALAQIFFYHFAGGLDPKSNGLSRIVGFNEQPFMGMALFFAALITLIISVYVAYSMFPFVLNKEKLNIRKGLLLAGFVGGLFELVLIVFMIILIVSESPNTTGAIIGTLPIGILSALGSLAYIVPFILCDFYMPEIKK